MTASLDGLHPKLMRPRVEALLADPDARAIGLYVVSAFRTIERQRELFQAAVKKYGSVAAARKWVAPPGKSNHGPKVDGYGTAVDVGIPGYKAVSGQWPAAIETKVNALATRHGLFSPLEWEDWHFEPIPNWKPPSHPEDDEMRYPANDPYLPLTIGSNGQGTIAIPVAFADVTSVTVKANDDWTHPDARVLPTEAQDGRSTILSAVGKPGIVGVIIGYRKN